MFGLTLTRTEGGGGNPTGGGPGSPRLKSCDLFVYVRSDTGGGETRDSTAVSSAALALFG